MKELNANLTIIICPKSVIRQWEEHLKVNYPEYKIYVNEIKIEINIPTVLIFNYDVVWRKQDLLKCKDYTLILDESQFIKNIAAKRTKFVLKMQPQNVILLSGTPTNGKYEELYTQIKLLGWNINKTLFYENYIEQILLNINGFKIPKVVGYKNVEHLKSRLNEYGAVFMKTEEVLTLPEQQDIKISVENTEEYKYFKDNRIIKLKDKELIGDTAPVRKLYLRQLASQYNYNKVNALKELLESTNKRVVVFYNYTKEMEIIKELTDRPISLINGKIHDLRNYERYNDSITIVQYQAGATGLNLQLADTVIYFSLPDRSDLFEQSKKRIHRIGQKNNCKYYYMITQRSVDVEMQEVLKQRKDYTDKLFEQKEEEEYAKRYK